MWDILWIYIIMIWTLGKLEIWYLTIRRKLYNDINEWMIGSGGTTNSLYMGTKSFSSHSRTYRVCNHELT